MDGFSRLIIVLTLVYILVFPFFGSICWGMIEYLYQSIYLPSFANWLDATFTWLFWHLIRMLFCCSYSQFIFNLIEFKNGRKSDVIAYTWLCLKIGIWDLAMEWCVYLYLFMGMGTFDNASWRLQPVCIQIMSPLIIPFPLSMC